MRATKSFFGGCALSLVIVNLLADLFAPSWRHFTGNSMWMLIIIAPFGAALAWFTCHE